MYDRALQRYRHRYVLVMLLATRAATSVSGVLGLYYVDVSTAMTDAMRASFFQFGALFVPLAVAATIPLALWNTRHVRRVMTLLAEGTPVTAADGRQAGRQAVRFPSRQLCGDVILAYLLAIFPIMSGLSLRHHPSHDLLWQVFIAGSLAVAAVLFLTFYATEQGLQPVIRKMLDEGIDIEFDSMPQSRLGLRMLACVSTILLVSTGMISAMAVQRAQDLLLDPSQVAEAVDSLRRHTWYITIAAVIVGFAYSRMLAKSVGSRVNHLVDKMKRVEAGHLHERMQPTGNDEIDILARQFNKMVSELSRADREVRDLNLNLERKVQERTEELSRSEQSLQESLEKLRELDRLKTEFFSNISHELRSPLMAIISPVEDVLQSAGTALSSTNRHHLEITQINASRLLKLINQLLEFSRIEAGAVQFRPSLFDVNQLVTELTMAAEPLTHGREVALRTVLDDSLPLITADRDKLDSVISNLVSNAIKFTPRGGEITVTTERCEEGLYVSVQDTGIGIAQQHLDKLFERFSQVDGSTSRQFAGSGLGLALVKELVELHGGGIHVDTEPDVGSCFWFVVPIESEQDGIVIETPTNASFQPHRFAELLECPTVDDQPTSKEEANSDIPSAALASADHPARPAAPSLTDNVLSTDDDRKPHVLVVDDTPEMRLMIGGMLSSDYQVTFAADGVEAMSAVDASLPDIILSDVMMPNMDGYELCRRIKNNPETLHIPLVLLTARAELSMKLEGLHCGADDYLVKPFDRRELHARVRSLLRLRRMHYILNDRNHELEQTLQTLQRTQKQLVQAEKMSSLGELVAGLAHEINNSINAVYNGIDPLQSKMKRLEADVQAALTKGDADPQASGEIRSTFGKIQRLGEVIERGATRTAKIVSDLKSFSHPGSETNETFLLDESLETCINLLHNRFQNTVEIQRDFGHVGEVTAPFGQLNQVFMNILVNAGQAMPNGGTIEVSTTRIESHVEVCIRDTGCGIPPEKLERIFDPFFTTKAPGVGTGLGMSISYSIIQQLGGEILVASTEGVGTEFTIRIPTHCPEAAQPTLMTGTQAT